MKIALVLLVWCLLFVVAWPVALAAIVLFPLVWLLALPFRLVAIVVSAALAFVKAVLFLPARLLGVRS
jgi:hypothetical protein